VEGEEALLGAYDAVAGNSFTSWPDSQGGVIDVQSSILKIQDAIIQYFNGTVGSASADDGLLVDGENQIRFPSLVFKTANGYDRSAQFGSRDVRIGDAIRVTFGSTTIDSIISGLIADTDDATVTDPATMLRHSLHWHTVIRKRHTL
jgi:hypothetical protein